MAIKKSELYSSLWKSCDELRGSMDASQYKDYVLVLLFMKYVSDKGDKLVDIPKGASFQDMLKLKGQPDIGDKINKIIGELAKANDLTGIITEADFNDDEKLGRGKEKVDRLSNLLEIFENEGLDFKSNRAENDDILDDAYEYLMRHFATESGKSKGQFYTPAEVSRIKAKIIGIEKSKSQSETLYDPTCGSGSLLLKAADEAPHGITIYGQEKEKTNRGLAVMNMWLHSNPAADIKLGNTLTSTRNFLDENTGDLKRFDYVVANPPFSDKAWSNGVDVENDIFKRFDGFGVPPKKNGDYAFLLHLIKVMKSTGKGSIILPLGVLFRGNAEGEIRKNIVNRGYIKGIIGLPTNLFYGTGIAACIIVLDKSDANNRKGIFMIDASKGFMKDGNKNRLRAQDIHKIVDVFNRQLEIPKYSRLVLLKEIADPKNDYNLNIPRYIDSQEDEDIQDIEAHLLGGIPDRDVEGLNNYWSVYPNLKNELFQPNSRPNYWELKTSNDRIKSTIFDHSEFKAYAKKMDKTFKKWKNDNTEYLKDLKKGCKPKDTIHQISEEILKIYHDKELIDKYDIYQHLMDYWADIMQDDIYELSADGWKAGNIVTRLIKKTKKGDTTTEKEVAGIEGLEGRLIPPELIIQEYFFIEQKAIDIMKSDLELTIGERQELTEEHSGEEGALQDVSNKKDAENALNELLVQAWEEYFKDSFKEYKKINKQLEQILDFINDNSENSFIIPMRNPKNGKVSQKSITDRLKRELSKDEKNFLNKYLKNLKEINNHQKTIKDLKAEIFDEIKILTKEKPEADYLKEILIVMKYLELLEKESNLKTEIKKSLEELEKKIIEKYPKLSIEEIKTIVVDKKWITTIENKVKTELDAISHRLTERIKILAERYDMTLPQLHKEVDTLRKKVEKHLKKMDYTW